MTTPPRAPAYFSIPGRILIVLLAAPLFCLFAWASVEGALDCWRAANETRIATPGVVKLAWLTPCTTGGRYSQPGFETNIQFSWLSNGHPYSGGRVSAFGGRCLSKQNAEMDLKRNSPGAPVTAYVLDSNPADAVLEPSSMFHSPWPVLLGAGMLIGFLGWAILAALFSPLPPKEGPSAIKRREQRPIRVYLDSGSPRAGWVHARTAAEAVRLLEKGFVGQLSISETLRPASDTGMDVLLWIRDAVKTRGLIAPDIGIHRASENGKDQMSKMIAEIDAL